MKRNGSHDCSLLQKQFFLTCLRLGRNGQRDSNKVGQQVLGECDNSNKRA